MKVEQEYKYKSEVLQRERNKIIPYLLEDQNRNPETKLTTHSNSQLN
jgi:predicted transcriptional regulator